MHAAQDHDEAILAAGGLPAALIRLKEPLLTVFRDRTRQQLPAARQESPPIIINTLPAFITRLAIALDPKSELHFASEYSNLALAHGNERAKLTGYSLADLVREYQVLRETLVEYLPREQMPTAAEWAVVHRSIDEAIADAASSFMKVHQRFRDQFTAALSHDFRGPLSNAVNFVELIRRNAEPTQSAHFATRALDNLKHISRMIGDLLDSTRASAGAQLSIRVEAAEAGVLARQVIDDLTPRVGDRFKLDAKEPVHGYWDCGRLKQALQNLLENAVKYGKDYAPITCRVSTTKGKLFLSVHNEGEPIARDVIPVLFEPFRRSVVAERSDKPGWGLGLMLVQAIAEAHGGSVAVESTPEEGTVFTLDILCDARGFEPTPSPADVSAPGPVTGT